VKIQGLDKLQRQLEEASRAFQTLDGEVAKVTIVAGDESSVQAAIRQVEEAVDRKAAPYRGNPFVDPLIKQMKEKYREHIIKRGRERA
jgi:hypothetical protein